MGSSILLPWPNWFPGLIRSPSIDSVEQRSLSGGHARAPPYPPWPLIRLSRVKKLINTPSNSFIFLIELKMPLTRQHELILSTIDRRLMEIKNLEERANRRPSRGCARWQQCCLASRPLENFFLEDGCLVCQLGHHINLLRAELKVKEDLEGKGLNHLFWPPC